MLFASGDISAEYDHMQYSTLGLDTGLDDRDTFLRSKESFVLFYNEGFLVICPFEF